MPDIDTFSTVVWIILPALMSDWSRVRFSSNKKRQGETRIYKTSFRRADSQYFIRLCNKLRIFYRLEFSSFGDTVKKLRIEDSHFHAWSMNSLWFKFSREWTKLSPKFVESFVLSANLPLLLVSCFCFSSFFHLVSWKSCIRWIFYVVEKMLQGCWLLVFLFFSPPQGSTLSMSVLHPREFDSWGFDPAIKEHHDMCLKTAKKKQNKGIENSFIYDYL